MRTSIGRSPGDAGGHSSKVKAGEGREAARLQATGAGTPLRWRGARAVRGAKLCGSFGSAPRVAAVLVLRSGIADVSELLKRAHRFLTAGGFLLVGDPVNPNRAAARLDSAITIGLLVTGLPMVLTQQSEFEAAPPGPTANRGQPSSGDCVGWTRLSLCCGRLGARRRREVKAAQRRPTAILRTAPWGE
jgi:hypothetical protein